jgi:hypothetical protein
MAATLEEQTFARDWNTCDRRDRAYVRRRVRIGRVVEEPSLSALATGYARYQMQRPWMRFFWFWFAPGMLLALSAAASIRPIFVGATLALGAQAVWAYFSLRKVARRPT